MDETLTNEEHSAGSLIPARGIRSEEEEVSGQRRRRMNEHSYEIEIHVRRDTEPYWHFVQSIHSDDVVPLHIRQRHFEETLQHIVSEATKKLFEAGT